MINKHEIKTKLKEGLLYQDLIKTLEEFNAIIAGGAITSVVTGRKINDYDIYFKTKEEFEKANKYFVSSKDFKAVAVTDNANTYKRESVSEEFIITIQLIKAEHLFFDDSEDLIKSFDFTINMAAYDIKTDMLYMHKDFIDHNIERKLVYNEDTIYPIVSMHRAIKYMQRGYNFSGYEQVKIALAINNLMMKDYRDLKVQLQGIDTSVFQLITDKLMENPDREYKYEDMKKEIKNFGGLL